MAAAVAASGFACSSFDEASPGPPDGGGVDATREDVIAQDGSSSGDAGSAGEHRCTGTEKLFDRFGRVLPAGANGWQSTPDAALELLEDSGAEPPVFFASVPVLEDGDKRNNTMSREFQLGADSSLCVELDVLLETSNGTFTVDSFAEILSVQAANTTSVFFELDPQGVAFSQNKTHAIVPDAALGKWQHVVMRVPYGSSEHPSLEIDGKPSAAGNESAGPKPGAFRVALGLFSESRTGKTAAVQVYVDNFRVTTAP